MRLCDIRAFPTTVKLPIEASGIHESVFRSYQCLEKVRDLLTRGVPADVLVELIDDLMEAPDSAIETTDDPLGFPEGPRVVCPECDRKWSPCSEQADSIRKHGKCIVCDANTPAT